MPRKFATRGKAALAVPRPRLLLFLCAGAEPIRRALQKHAHLDCAGSLSEARQFWRPGRYDMVLATFDQDPGESAHLCKEIKDQAPGQLLVFLAGTGENLPPEPCPDALFPKGEPPEYLLARIETFLAVRSQAYPPAVPARPPALAPRA